MNLRILLKLKTKTKQEGTTCYSTLRSLGGHTMCERSFSEFKLLLAGTQGVVQVCIYCWTLTQHAQLIGGVLGLFSWVEMSMP